MGTTVNKVTLCGELTGHFEYSHKTHGRTFYTNYIEVSRFSDKKDTIPIFVDVNLIDASVDYRGKLVEIKGYYRSRNDKYRLLLSVLVKDMELLEVFDCTNHIELTGYIGKTPYYRLTSLNKREIVDLLLVVNRKFGEVDYIPCVVWDRNARYASELPVGTKIKVIGRIQSREYCRQGEEEVRIAYEVSVSKIEEWEEENAET